MYIYKAAVIGAGTMGAQIAQVITYSGLPVLLKDVNPEMVESGLKTIRKIYQARVEKGKMSAKDAEQKMALVSGTTDYEDFGDVDIVIEAAFEDINVKKDIFRDLDRVCPEGSILATNTSSLSISALASTTRRPQKVVGLHFFNPAHVMKLVEVVPGLETAAETVDDVVAFSESLRKIPVKVQECAGFLVNRLLMPYLNEAAFLLQEGQHQAQKIDEDLVSFGMPMGPFTLLDMIGIDVAERVAVILNDAFGPRMQSAEILSYLVKEKRLGNKSGAGFYVYSGEEDKVLPGIIEKLQKSRNITVKRDLGQRLLLPMINEAAICLQENVSTSNDIDIAMIAGTGFPQEKGGPLHYADQIGIDVIVKELKEYTEEIGPRFWPAPILKRMVAAGHLGVKSKQGFFSY